MIVEAIVAALLVLSGLTALVAALGLWRLQDFFQRMHAPALAYTLASWSVTLASILHFSASGGISLHVWAIIILLSITAPLTTVLLARAGLFRGRQAGEALPRPLRNAGEREQPRPPPAGDV
jgi:multicomponent K+:H+ antiporter subunit G